MPDIFPLLKLFLIFFFFLYLSLVVCLSACAVLFCFFFLCSLLSSFFFTYLPLVDVACFFVRTCPSFLYPSVHYNMYLQCFSLLYSPSASLTYP